MDSKRVLLMHISRVSGHRRASLAIEQALQQLDGQVKTCNIDAFSYVNPRLEKIVNRLYMGVIKAMPRLWDYLYDNEIVYRKVKEIRSLLHKQSDKKIAQLFVEFKPDIVVCTQAFPCGMVADYKRRHNLNTPLIGVLTDYAPHTYWLNEFVDIYVVPAPQIKQRFAQKQIPEERLQALGIPIGTQFRTQTDCNRTFQRLELDPNLAVILIMGGGQGLGPIKEIASVLDKIGPRVQLIVVCGTNRKLYRWFKANKTHFSKPIRVMGYTKQIGELMAISSFIVTKPGGLTCAEALSKSLPMIIVNSLPGQENQNTRFLLDAAVALKAQDLTELQSLAEQLLSDTARLKQLRKKAGEFARSDSALEIARLILSTIKQS